MGLLDKVSILFKEPNVLLSKVHTLLLRSLYGYSIKNKALVYYKSKIYSDNKKVTIGEKTKTGRSPKGFHAGMPFYTTINNEGDNAQIIIGRNCRINGAYIHAKNSITIGDNSVIGAGCVVKGQYAENSLISQPHPLVSTIEIK